MTKVNIQHHAELVPRAAYPNIYTTIPQPDLVLMWLSQYTIQIRHAQEEHDKLNIKCLNLYMCYKILGPFIVSFNRLFWLSGCLFIISRKDIIKTAERKGKILENLFSEKAARTRAVCKGSHQRKELENLGVSKFWCVNLKKCSFGGLISNKYLSLL